MTDRFFVRLGHFNVRPPFDIEVGEYNSNVTMVYGTYKELVTGAYKPTYSWGASHCWKPESCHNVVGSLGCWIACCSCCVYLSFLWPLPKLQQISTTIQIFNQKKHRDETKPTGTHRWVGKFMFQPIFRSPSRTRLQLVRIALLLVAEICKFWCPALRLLGQLYLGNGVEDGGFLKWGYPTNHPFFS